MSQPGPVTLHGDNAVRCLAPYKTLFVDRLIECSWHPRCGCYGYSPSRGEENRNSERGREVFMAKAKAKAGLDPGSLTWPPPFSTARQHGKALSPLGSRGPQGF